MHQVTKVVVDSIVWLIVLTLCAAGTDSNAEPLPEYTIRAIFPGNTPQHLDEVLSAVENQLKDSLNVKLDFQFMPAEQYRQKITTMMATGDGTDIHLNAQWLSIYTMIADGAIQPWDDLLAQYGSNILRSLPDPMLKGNTFYGKMYGIPNGNVYGKVVGWILRKDLRERYDLPKPTTLEEFERFLLAIKEHHPDLIPISWQGGSFTPLEALLPLETQTFGIKVGNVEVNIYAHADGTIEPVRGIFDDPHALRSIEVFRRWYANGLIDRNVLTQQDAFGAFTSSQVTAGWEDVTNIDHEQSLLASNIPGAEVEYFKPGWGTQPLTTDFRMWNFVVLNSACKNPVRVTQFLDWIFADQAHYDLLAYGIEGVHWIDTGNGTYGIPDGVEVDSNYDFPGYVLLWKPEFERIPIYASEEQRTWIAFLRDPRNMVTSPLLGFTPDLSKLKTEFAKCNAIWPTVVRPIQNGLLDPETAIPEARKKLSAAGYDRIIDELARQVEAFQSTQNP